VKRMIALMVLFTLLLSACGTAEVPAPALLEPVQAQLESCTVARGVVFSASTATGSVVAYMEPVAFSVNGTVADVQVLPGQQVQEGDVLAVLDTESLQEKLEDLQRQLSSAAYQAQQKNENLSRSVDICQLQLDERIRTNTEQMLELEQVLLDGEAEYLALQQAHADALELLERELKDLQAQLDTLEPTAAQVQELQAQIAQQQAQIVAAKASHAQADADAAAKLETVRQSVTADKQELAAKQKLAELDLEDAETALYYSEQLQFVSLEKLQKQVKDIQLQLDNAVITAPFTGIVMWISKSTRAIADEPYIYVSDPSQKYIRTDRVITYTNNPPQVIRADIGGQMFDMTLRQQSAQEQVFLTLNGIVPTLALDFPKGTEVPEGSNAMIYYISQYRENVLRIPTAAVLENEDGNYVLLAVDGEQVQTYVETGLRNSVYTEIVSGLKEGDVVYVAN